MDDAPALKADGKLKDAADIVWYDSESDILPKSGTRGIPPSATGAYWCVFT